MNDDVNNRRPFSSNHDSGPGNGAHPAVEQLSEYLDGATELEEAERHAIEGHLTSCQTCQAVLDDLRTMVQTLAALPVREAPRSYAIGGNTLRPAMAPARAEPVVLRESAQWHARHADKVRWATAVAAILFVFVISADLVTNGLGGISTGQDDEAAITSVQDGAGNEETMSSLAAEEPEPVPTPAIAEDAMEEAAPESEEEAPPAVEEEAAEQESSDAPADDAADADAADDTTLRATEEEEEEGAGESNDEVSAFSVEEEAISDEPASEAAANSEDSSQMRWRVVEVTLALVLALLLAVMIGLPKQRGARRR